VKPIAVARRYARSLADVAGGKDGGRLEKVAAELLLAAEVMRRAPQVLRFLDNPSVRPEDRDAVLGTLARGTGAGDLTRRFLRLLIERRRLAALPEIAEAFGAIKDHRLGIVPVEATTAVPLSAAESRRLKESLEKMTGRAVRLSLSVDPAVLGGARSRIGSRVYDGTLKRKLSILRERLAAAR